MNNIDHYTFRIDWSEEDECHIARCLEYPTLLTHGDTPEQALYEIREAVKFTIKWMEEEGEPIPTPITQREFKGNITLRLAPQMHKELSIRSEEEGISLNQFISTVLETNLYTNSISIQLAELKKQVSKVTGIAIMLPRLCINALTNFARKSQQVSWETNAEDAAVISDLIEKDESLKQRNDIFLVGNRA